MSIYKWYKIFNHDDFVDSGLVSVNYEVELEDLGPKEFLATKGNLVSVTHEGIILPILLNDKNPFEFESNAIYKDPDTADVYWGYLQGAS